jgi:hypothetical protein
VHFEILSPFGMGRTDTRIDALLWASIVALCFAIPSVRGFLMKWASLWLWIGVCALLLAVALVMPPFGMTYPSGEDTSL